MNNLKADILCFTGDLIEEIVEVLKEALPVLKQLKATLGKIAILGNHDYKIDKSEEVINAFQKSGFTFLLNNKVTFEKQGSKIYFAGLDDMISGNPKLSNH
ncbi:hypothetical protein D0463_13005 [Bacillus sp. V59.32b]|nr:hypothetical protein D0463_13005 [Bacillus sp. V59.32b]